VTDSARVVICDVAPRDGLQNDAVILEPPVRAELVDRLSGCGLPRIEVGSFVNPQRVPQMAGTEDVAAAMHRHGGVLYAGLAVNERGYERLVASGLDEVRFVLAATETLNTKNAGLTVAQSQEQAARMAGRAREDGIRGVVTIGAAFGCPFEGAVDPGAVLGIAADAVAAGADEVIFADTIGVGVPRQVRRLVEGALPLGRPVGFHFHNTRNTGFANAFAAIEAGATVFDASAGGIGGCPFAPRATGNIATEDLVYLLDGEGIETGVDIDALIGVAEWLEGILGRQLDGQVYRAGGFSPVAA